jgi:hypothetical protein
MINALAQLADQVFCTDERHERWFVEAHQFRIDTGRHRTAYARRRAPRRRRSGRRAAGRAQGVKGAETRVFEATGCGQRFTLTSPGP